MPAIVVASTPFLGMSDDQSVVFIIQTMIRGQAGFKYLSQGLIILLALNQSQLSQQPPGVAVNHEYRALKRVEQDIVGSFGTDAVDRQQRPPEPGGIPL